MKLAKGPRPWSIWTFGAVFLGAAISSHVLDMGLLEVQEQVFNLRFPWIEWTRDHVIVFLSALLTIAIIPVVWIFLTASRVARWIVTGFSFMTVLNLPLMVWQWATTPGLNLMYLREPVLILVAVIMLWLPSANHWFRQEDGVDVSTFE